MTPWVLRLIIANAVMFILTSLLPGLTTQLMFVPAFVLVRPWTLITYMFLHAGFFHILFNMLALFFFGPRLELHIGDRQFLWLYFISGIMGAVLSIFFTPHTAIVGASGAIFGVMLGFAYYWPTEPIYVYGILPIQARWLVVIMTGLSLFGGFGGMSDGTAHFAHLGGFLGGYLYLKFITANSRAARYQRQFEKPEVSSADIERWKTISREQLHPVNREELDRLMNKVNANGVQSLTPAERDFLDRFSHR
ncbi:MAG TPA: rhomboid family intramembrane serine protease [Bacteroidota bacterium]|nr:rhomboid family intramembrane serine protease [Bacteroidota bacterium]